MTVGTIRRLCLHHFGLPTDTPVLDPARPPLAAEFAFDFPG
jgi:hypothetical protein